MSTNPQTITRICMMAKDKISLDYDETKNGLALIINCDKNFYHSITGSILTLESFPSPDLTIETAQLVSLETAQRVSLEQTKCKIMRIISISDACLELPHSMTDGSLNIKLHGAGDVLLLDDVTKGNIPGEIFSQVKILSTGSGKINGDGLNTDKLIIESTGSGKIFGFVVGQFLDLVLTGSAHLSLRVLGSCYERIKKTKSSTGRITYI